mgnify:CR=1 FL=1
MKQITEKTRKILKILASIIIIIVILIGGIIVGTKGFNKELRYGSTQTIEIYFEQNFDMNKVKEIVNEQLGQENIVQTIEIYKDMVSIKAKNITEEQKNNIVSKLKENYEFKQTAEETTINTIPATRIRDMYKPYVMPYIISAVLILVYMLIRYYKKGIVNVLTRAICVPLIAELLLLSVIAIARIPVGRIIPTLVLSVYILSVLYVIIKNEK